MLCGILAYHFWHTVFSPSLDLLFFILFYISLAHLSTSSLSPTKGDSALWTYHDRTLCMKFTLFSSQTMRKKERKRKWRKKGRKEEKRDEDWYASGVYCSVSVCECWCQIAFPLINKCLSLTHTHSTFLHLCRHGRLRPRLRLIMIPQHALLFQTEIFNLLMSWLIPLFYMVALLHQPHKATIYYPGVNIDSVCCYSSLSCECLGSCRVALHSVCI